MKLFNDETSTEYVNKNMYFETPSQLNISSENSNGSLKRDLSADYIQKLLKKYNEELQIYNEKDKNNLSPTDKDSSIYNKCRDTSSIEYMYNVSSFSNVMESVNANILNDKFNENHNDSSRLETKDHSDHKNSSSLNIHKKNEEAKFRQYEYSDKYTDDTQKNNPLLSLKHNLIIEEIVPDDRTSLIITNNNDTTCIDHDTKENVQFDKIEEKTKNFKCDKISQESIIYNTKMLNNLNGMKKATNSSVDNVISAEKIIATDKSGSYKYTPLPYTANNYAPHVCFNGSAHSKNSSNDFHLNYSVESSLLSPHKISGHLDTVQSETCNIQMSHTSSPIDMNQSLRSCEEQRNNSFEPSDEKYRSNYSEHRSPLESTLIKKKQMLDRTTETKNVISPNSIVHKNDSEKATQKELIADSIDNHRSKNSTMEKLNRRFLSSESFKKDKTSMKKKTLKVYSLDNIKNGKLEIPKIIFKPLPMNLLKDNVIEQHNNNTKLKQFMNHCNESVNLIMKYPRIEKKKTNTIRMPPSYTSTMIDHIGLPIIYEDDFDRKNQHPNVVNLHMGNVFEKHVFNMLKNKKELGKKLFKEKQIFEKYNYENDQGFWISNIDKERLVNPELNDSYVTELVYEKKNSYDLEMEILNTCENYHATVPPIQELYMKNNFCKFLCNTKMYVPNLKPSVATIMRRYDVTGISDYKISHMSFGIDPVYNN